MSSEKQLGSITDFTDDKEKMKDFYILSKIEFLKSYSYLTELEYDLTKQEVFKDNKRTSMYYDNDGKNI